LDELLAGGAVICLPTTPGSAPLRGETLAARRAQRGPMSMLTCVTGMTGGPQLSLPLGEVDGLPIGLSLLGAPGSDEMLLSFATAVAKAL
jgi:amidase